MMNRSRTSDEIAHDKPLICTIGHSNRTLDTLLGLLQRNDIVRVLDVRTVPRSRHNPQFNQDVLPASLEEVQISYTHLSGLGGLRHARGDSPNTGWRNLSFRGYADYMQTSQFADNVQWVANLARTERCVLMCAEAVPWRCHRSMIGDALLVRGIRVEDIIGPKYRKPHVLTAFACVDGTQVTYPLPFPADTPASRTVPSSEITMAHKFNIGDHVSWNAEVGRVSGRIIKVHIRNVDYKEDTHHATMDDSQYEINSDNTDHIAMHKETTLKKITD